MLERVRLHLGHFLLSLDGVPYNDLCRAAIIIHELNHDLFSDQKSNGKKVYGEKAARDLAVKKPRSARRSSENIEWFCMRLQDPIGKL